MKKYHRGQWQNGHLVFGRFKRSIGKYFLSETPDWKASTLKPLIQRCILSDSHIFSDGWTEYANIDKIVNGIYIHNLINLKKTLLTKKIAMSIQTAMKICGCMQRWNSVVTLAHVHSSHLICMNLFGKTSSRISIYLFHFQKSVWKYHF